LIIVGIKGGSCEILVLFIDVNEWCSDMPPECASDAETTISRVQHCLANEYIVGFHPFYNYNFDSGKILLLSLFYRWFCIWYLIVKWRKSESLKKVQHNKIENVAGSVWLSLFMDGTGKCKLPSTPGCLCPKRENNGRN
jgi:hypothetical protein